MDEFRRGDTASWDREQVRRRSSAPQGRRSSVSGGRRTSAQPARRSSSAPQERHVAPQERPPQAAPKNKKRKKRRLNPLVKVVMWLLFVAISSCILAGSGWLLMSDLCAFNRGPIRQVTVEVTASDTVDTVTDKLHNVGLIKYKWFFRLFADFSHAEEDIGIGSHELNTDMDYRSLIKGMEISSGNMTAETVTVTIPEGYTVAQTIKLLAKNGVNTEEKLLEAAQTADFDYSYIDNDSEDINRLEGYLFPDTYEFYVGHDAKGALNRLISTFDKKLNDDRMALVEASEYSLQEIIIIASLIEKETDGGDQDKIASVIYNRLKDDGSHGTYGVLNIDAALLYGLPDHTGPLTNEDKAVDTRYNLYKYAGLPPTAIANPGIDAIDAALKPAETNYYYYALGKDGKHHYSTTLQEHNNFLNSGNYGG